ETRGVAPELARELVTRVGGGGDHVGVEGVRVAVRQLGEPRLDVGAERGAEATLQAVARDVLLETAARAAPTGQPVGHDLRVPELPRRIAGTAPQRAIEYGAGAHAGSDEHRQERARPPMHAVAILAPG